MNITRNVRWQLLAQGGAFVLLLLLATGLLSWVAREYRAEWDVTANARNTLSQGTQDALRQLDGPISITAYAIAQDGGSDLHKLIQEKIRPWQRVKPDIALTLVDPRDDPKRANAAGLRSPNELVIEYKKRSEHLPLGEFNEQNLVNAMIRLSRTSSAVVYWLDSHGERKLNGAANHDLGEFGRQLQLKGYKATTYLGYENRVKEIVKMVESYDAKLLVMGGHRHQGWKDYIFGETIESVRHKVKIPVLIVNT